MGERKILCVIHPFDLKQDIYVYQSGNKLLKTESKIEDISKLIFNLAKEYQTNSVNFLGSKKYSENIIKEIQEIEINTYNKNEIKFNFI